MTFQTAALDTVKLMIAKTTKNQPQENIYHKFSTLKNMKDRTDRMSQNVYSVFVKLAPADSSVADVSMSTDMAFY